jgi:hypothetical protein
MSCDPELRFIGGGYVDQSLRCYFTIWFVFGSEPSMPLFVRASNAVVSEAGSVIEAIVIQDQRVQLGGPQEQVGQVSGRP